MASPPQRAEKKEIVLLDDGDEDQKQTEDVLKKKINWNDYYESKLISESDKGLLLDIDQKSSEEQDDLLVDRGPAYAEMFVRVVAGIQAKDPIQYLLSFVEKLLLDKPLRSNLFHGLTRGNLQPYAPFMRFVVPESNDSFILNKAVRILALIFGRGGSSQTPELLDLVKYLVSRLSRARGRDIIFTLTAIKDLLKNPETRSSFLKEGGLKCLTPYLKFDNQNTQSIYLSGFAIWLISFDKECLSALAEWEVVAKLAEIIKQVTKEKVVRISFAILVNLLNQKKFNEEMVASGVNKTIDGLNSRTWKDDDLISDMDTVKKDLDETIILLSSFEKYQSEVHSGRLEWTPVHCEQFFRENSTKFEGDSFSLIKQLTTLLTSNDELTAEVACYDLGEFARFHPDGKRILTNNGGKRELLAKMTDYKNPKIARQALLAVQKLMVTNWEFLSKNSGDSKSNQ